MSSFTGGCWSKSDGGLAEEDDFWHHEDDVAYDVSDLIKSTDDRVWSQRGVCSNRGKQRGKGKSKLA
jgi:hypothetical protein